MYLKHALYVSKPFSATSYRFRGSKPLHCFVQTVRVVFARWHHQAFYQVLKIATQFTFKIIDKILCKKYSGEVTVALNK